MANDKASAIALLKRLQICEKNNPTDTNKLSNLCICELMCVAVKSRFHLNENTVFVHRLI